MNSTENEDKKNFNADHRKMIRERELERVVTYFPKGTAVLEVGAGAGWQAKRLAERGFTVTAIDIPQSRYHSFQEWEVIDYDGYHIPLADKSVDVIFSSNVLEHIPHIDQFMIEMQRVLKPGGVAVHVMPTTLWRFITTWTFYVQRLEQVVSKLLGKKAAPVSKGDEEQSSDNQPRKGVVAKLRRAFLPTPHGVRGNVLTEHYYFSKGFWLATFERGGWDVVSTHGAGLLYSGYRVCGHALPVQLRAALAQAFGSSCRIYIAKVKS